MWGSQTGFRTFHGKDAHDPAPVHGEAYLLPHTHPTDDPATTTTTGNAA